jgi:hypothetical protein
LVVTVQIESHIKRLDEDLGQFAEDLKHGTSNYGRFLSLKMADFTHNCRMLYFISSNILLMFLSHLQKGRYLQMNHMSFHQFQWLAGMTKGGLVLVHHKHQRSSERENGTEIGVSTLI